MALSLGLGTRSATVVVVVRSKETQFGHLDGGGRLEDVGSFPATGSREGQEMVACRSLQKRQKSGFDLLTTRGFPRCVDLSRGVRGLQIGSQVLTELRRFCLSEL